MTNLALVPETQDAAWYLRQQMSSTRPEAAPSQGTQATGEHGGYSSEEDFVEGLRRCENPAFEELCRRHFRRVRTVLYRVLGNDREVADLAQEAVVCAMKAAPRFRGNSGQLGAWFTSIAVNMARDAIRRRTVFRKFFSPEEQNPDEVMASLATVEQVETVKRTYRVLDKMSADDRITFSLRFIDQMTMEEVAVACDTSVSTAKRRVTKARSRFNLLAAKDPNLAELLGGDE